MKQPTPTNNFEALRMGAALVVLWSHQHALMGRPDPVWLGTPAGGVAVMVFFGISGYLCTRSWHADPHVGRFAARRLLRLWPALLAAIALGLVLAAGFGALPLGEFARHAQTRQYLGNALFQFQPWLPGAWPQSALPSSANGSLWTLPIELQCYALLAAAGWLGLLRGRVMAAWLLLALGFVALLRYQAAPQALWTGRHGFLLLFGAAFVTGCLMARTERLWAPRRWSWVALLAAGLWLLRDLAHPAQLLLTAAALGALAVLMGSARTPVVRAAGRWGDPSYGLYVYAFPVQQAVLAALGRQVSFGLALGLSVALTAALAVASWRWIEAPALRFKPKAARPGVRDSEQNRAQVGVESRSVAI